MALWSRSARSPRCTMPTSRRTRTVSSAGQRRPWGGCLGGSRGRRSEGRCGTGLVSSSSAPRCRCYGGRLATPTGSRSAGKRRPVPRRAPPTLRLRVRRAPLRAGPSPTGASGPPRSWPWILPTSLWSMGRASRWCCGYELPSGPRPAFGSTCQRGTRGPSSRVWDRCPLAGAGRSWGRSSRAPTARPLRSNGSSPICRW